MPRRPSPSQIHASQQNGKRSRGPSPEGAKRSSLNSMKSGLRSQTIALAHESSAASERGQVWQDFYHPQSPAAFHLTNECARATLLADRADRCQQAELDKQAREVQRTWRRKQRRRMRYLAGKLRDLPETTREQLKTFGEGVGLLIQGFEILILELQTHHYLKPEVLEVALMSSGIALGPESIRENVVAYSINLQNLGCSPDVPAAVLAELLEPANRPAALRDRPRDELMPGDPDACRELLLGRFQEELVRLRELDERVRREADEPSLLEALNRASILTEVAARRVARAHAAARTSFHCAWKELVATLKRDREEGPPDSADDDGEPAGDEPGAGAAEAAEAAPDAVIIAAPAPAPCPRR